MARKKPEVEIHSCGMYDGWDRGSRELPNLVQITNEIEAALDVEFGYILRIRNARNSNSHFAVQKTGMI